MFTCKKIFITVIFTLIMLFWGAPFTQASNTSFMLSDLGMGIDLQLPSDAQIYIPEELREVNVLQIYSSHVDADHKVEIAIERIPEHFDYHDWLDKQPDLSSEYNLQTLHSEPKFVDNQEGMFREIQTSNGTIWETQLIHNQVIYTIAGTSRFEDNSFYLAILDGISFTESNLLPVNSSLLSEAKVLSPLEVHAFPDLKFPFTGTQTITCAYHADDTECHAIALVALDFSLENESVRAAHSGRVSSHYSSCVGNYAWLEDSVDPSYHTLYGHLTDITNIGDVSAGDEIAISGNTGNCSKGPHLHFFLDYNGTNVKPEPMCGLTGFIRYQEVNDCWDSTPPSDLLEVGVIVRTSNEGDSLDVYNVPDDSMVGYHVASGDTGIVTDGPVELADGRVLWQVQWYSGFYDLNDNPYVNPAPYPTEIVGWSDEAFLEPAPQTFSDVPLDNVFFPYIDMTVVHAIFDGYSDGTFSEASDIPRGAFAKGVYNAAKFTPDTSCGDFPDVPPTHEFYTEITTLKCLDIIHGYSDGTFRPEVSLLRDQSTKFITNTLVALGAIESAEACAEGVTQFPDVPTDSLFYDDIRCVKGLGIFAGFSDGTFRPEEVVSRGQAAKILTGGRSVLYYSRWILNSLLECALVNPAAGIYTGNSLDVICNLSGTNNLYGAQLTCTAQPTILMPTDIYFGSFFDPNARLTVPPEIDPANGTLIGAISLQNPALPIFGDSADNFATLQYQTVGAGTATLTCDTLLSNRDGFVLPSTSSEIEITVLPSTASSDGTIAYQGRLTHAGIEVTASGPITQTTITDAEGQYAFAGLGAGLYEIQADALRYLPSCTTIQLDDHESVALPATILAGGDVNNNDVINIGDASLIGASFNGAPSANARADINEDGLVNIQDLTILGGNYGKSGCQNW